MSQPVFKANSLYKKSHSLLEAIHADKWLSVWLARRFLEEASFALEKEPNRIINNCIDSTEAWLNKSKKIEPARRARNQPVVSAAYKAHASQMAAEGATEHYRQSGIKMSHADTRERYLYLAAADACKLVASQLYYDTILYSAARNAASSIVFGTEIIRSDCLAKLVRESLGYCIDYKIKHNQSFADFERVLEEASSEEQVKLLFYIHNGA
jgi:hypothetical protein